MAKYTRVLVDAMNLVHRAFHTTARGLNASDDKGRSLIDAPTLPAPYGIDAYPTGVLYVSLQFYLNLLRRWLPDQVIFVWDGDSRLTWRRRDFPGYKANRDTARAEWTDDEIRRREILMQVEVKDARDMVSGFGGINLYAPDSMEADDVISILSRRLTCPQNTRDLIVSTDRDLIQLVREHQVEVHSPMRDALIKQLEGGQIVEYCGTEKERLSESPLAYLISRSFVGDKSDGIPGVPGVGEVLADLLGPTIARALRHSGISPADISCVFNSRFRAKLEEAVGLVSAEGNWSTNVNTRALRMVQQMSSDTEEGRAAVAEFRRAFLLSDLHSEMYAKVENSGEYKTGIAKLTREYAAEMKRVRKFDIPALVKNTESPMCGFSSFFGRRGFRIAYDDENREEATIRVRECHNRNRRYIAALAPYVSDAWRNYLL